MAKRTESLYPLAKELADRLADRLGNQKLVLSAGVILLDKLKGEDREVACQEAKGRRDEQLDLYAERRALLDAKSWLEGLRIEAALAGAKDARNMHADLMAIIDQGLESRIRRQPAPNPMEDQIDEIKAAVARSPKNVQTIISERLSSLSREIRQNLGPKDSAPREVRDTLDAAEAHPEEQRHSGGRSRRAGAG